MAPMLEVEISQSAAVSPHPAKEFSLEIVII
jgi:hypothetical protein